MKKSLALIFALVMVTTLVACGNGAKKEESKETTSTKTDTASTGDDAEANAGNTESHLFGYTCMDLTNPFHIAMRDGMQDAIEENGDELITIDGQQDQTKQNEVINDLITQGIEVLFLNPVDSASVEPALEACAAAGVKVINVDSAVENLDMVETFIASDNYKAGYQCGEDIVKGYPDGANICVIENPLADSVVQRVAGLEDAIKTSKCKIIDRKSISTMDAVLGNAEDLLTANSDIDVFWGLNDDVSLIILGAVESAGRQDDIAVYSVDGSPSGKTSVRDGGLFATAAQSPVGIGKKAVVCAYALISGESIESSYYLETTLVTSENIDDMNPDNWD